jgi:hypothetical protein
LRHLKAGSVLIHDIAPDQPKQMVVLCCQYGQDSQRMRSDTNTTPDADLKAGPPRWTPYLQVLSLQQRHAVVDSYLRQRTRTKDLPHDGDFSPRPHVAGECLPGDQYDESATRQLIGSGSISTAGFKWQLAHAGTIALVNSFDMGDDTAQSYQAPSIGLRVPTNLGETQVPGHLPSELWGDAGCTADH